MGIRPIGPYPSLIAFVRALPSFCWQSFQEVLTMAETLDDSVCPFVLKVTISKVLKEGAIEKSFCNPLFYNGERKNIMKYKGVEKTPIQAP